VAHARAVQLYHRLKREHRWGGQIGIVLNMSRIYPATDSPADHDAAHLADGILNRWFIDPALLGRYPPDILALYRRHDLMPAWDAEELLAFQEDTLDFIGVNYY
jgi:6-phospho-beta-glucosidase